MVLFLPTPKQTGESSPKQLRKEPSTGDMNLLQCRFRFILTEGPTTSGWVPQSRRGKLLAQ